MWWKNRRRLRLWQDALELCKASDVESSGIWSWPVQLAARSGAIQVWITAGGKDWVSVLLEGPEGFSVLKLRPQYHKLWKSEIEIGDRAFDRAFFVEGPPRPASALLDATVRGQLVRASADCNSLEIVDGKLRVEVSEKKLPYVLPVLFKIGQHFAEPLDVETRIARNARLDPEAGVRLFNLQLLARERPGDPATLEALRIACSDKSPQVKAFAAIERGDKAHDVLLRLAMKAEDDDACARAVSHLGGKLPLERTRQILARALRKNFRRTARACLEELGRRGAAALGILVKVMTEEKGELAAAAALALGTTGEKAAQSPLLQALRSEESELREAAATALGQVGTVAAVQPLKDAAERFWLDLGLRKATHQAVVDIQSRLEDASPGQLSLASADAGQLSLAPSGAGQLSLARDEEA